MELWWKKKVWCKKKSTLNLKEGLTCQVVNENGRSRRELLCQNYQKLDGGPICQVVNEYGGS